MLLPSKASNSKSYRHSEIECSFGVHQCLVYRNKATQLSETAVSPAWSRCHTEWDCQLKQQGTGAPQLLLSTFASKWGNFREVCCGSRQQHWFKLQRQEIFLWEMMYILQQQARNLIIPLNQENTRRQHWVKFPATAQQMCLQQPKGMLTAFTQTRCSIKGQWVWMTAKGNTHKGLCS